MTAPTLDAHWMPFTANRQFKSRPAVARRRRRACTTGPTRRPQGARRRRRPAVRERGPCATAEITAAVHAHARDARLRTALPDGPPAVLRARAAHRVDRAGGARRTCSSPTPARKRWTPRSRSRVHYQRLKGAGRSARGSSAASAAITAWTSAASSLGGMIAQPQGVLGADAPRRRPHPHTHDPARNAFSRGQPEHGVELADDLEAPDRAARRLEHRRADRRADRGQHRRRCCRRRGTCSACARSARSTASC